MIIDARGAAGFAVAHVHGAFNAPVGRKEACLEQIHQGIVTNQLIIIYCNGPLCDAGDKVYEYFESQGFTNMRVFRPGWETLRVASDLWQQKTGSRACEKNGSGLRTMQQAYDWRPPGTYLGIDRDVSPSRRMTG